MADNSEEEEAINVTGNLSISDRMKLVQGVARGIQQQSKPQGNKDAEHYLYDGNDKAFHQWWRAIVNQLSGVYLDGIEELVKSTENNDYSEEKWNSKISQSDRQFIHQVITQTITPLQVDVIDNDNQKNGIKVLKHYFQLWGAPTLPNTIKALAELLSAKVKKHEDPTPSFKRLERVFAEYFPNTESIKTSMLFHMLDENKYRTILDTVEQRESRHW